MSTGIAAGRCRELALSTRARVPLHQLRSPASTSARPASRFSLPNAVSSAPIPPPELPSTNRSLFTHPQCVADKRHGPLNADVLGPGYQPDPSSPRSGPLSSTHPIHSSDASEPPGDLRQSQAALDGGALLSPPACHRSLSLPLRIAHVMPHGRSARCVRYIAHTLSDFQMTNRGRPVGPLSFKLLTELRYRCWYPTLRRSVVQCTWGVYLY
jgi:hypothetical protein